MSFASSVKTECCRLPYQRACCARAEAYGILLYCNTFTNREVRVITENADFAARVPKLFQRAFGVAFDHLPAGELSANEKYIFGLTQEDKLRHIIDSLGFSPRQNMVLHINLGLLEEKCCRIALLRGAFLAGGSVTDPNKRYHLELATPHAQASRELATLLDEMGLTPKMATRAGNTVLYFKQSEQIEDLLTLMGAPVAAMELMNAKMEKDLRNQVNRRVNCDAANVEKSVDASRQQVESITRLMGSGRLSELSAQVQEVAVARILHPELSLSELAATFDPPITKSCLNHRMRKLMQWSGQ